MLPSIFFRILLYKYIIKRGCVKVNNKRLRNNRIYFHLTDNEKKRLEQRLEAAGVRNRDAFVRKMVLDGYIIQIDTKPIVELARLLRNSTSNINQVAKRANESGSVYENDVLDLLAEVKSLNRLIVEAHSSILKLSEM